MEVETVELEEVDVVVVMLWLLVVFSLLDVLELVDVTTDVAYWNVAMALTCGE
ncbi:MAG: hypothetical protein JRN72_00795 [Nitrososphaerota archaeon]|nr:hypothetical protein [Nitrososphaerota archaeon]MDG6993433.1 hypothetical protein [Nitrososphaerota archaeon]